MSVVGLYQGMLGLEKSAKNLAGFPRLRRERRPDMADKRTSLAWTLALFFFSGATSLVYEVLWTRRLSLTFGHTVLAVSTVLTVFMSGLALGSFLAGRWSDRERRRLAASGDPRGSARFLAVYGVLELFIGGWALLSLLLLDGVEHVYLTAARGGAEGVALHALVFLGSFLVLLPPTTAMGATLPAFTQLLVATREDVGSWLSRIYGWNTLGACVGAAVGGFVLLPNLGLLLSVAGAAAGNLIIGVLAIVGSKRQGDRPVEPEVEESAPEDRPSSGGGGWLLPVAFGVSGFAAMVYQLGWTRGLILSLGSSTYSFAIILTAFLASLGLGSLIYKKGMGSRTPRVWHLGVLQMVIALSALMATYGIGRLPEVMVVAIPALDKDFAKILLFDFGLALVLMFLPTLAMGLTFPLVTHLYTDRISSLGKRLGEAYAANTCGAILGSFLAGFVLVPTFGAQKALLGAVVTNLLVGVILAAVDRSNGAPFSRLGGVAAAGLVLVALVPAWDPTRLSAGAGIYARADHFLFKPAFYQDGVSATVTVGFNGSHSPYLKVNGKTDASLGLQDMAHQILTGLLPAALHPEPKKIALVGLGSGVTAATLVALDSVEIVRCAELEAAIVDVQSYFGPYTEHVLNHKKLDLEVNDGRTFILGAPEQFDLIVSQPSNPWIAGIGNLYTEDFYKACSERLTDGGLMCQWFQLYSVSQYDLDLVLSTFYSVFPEGMVFQIGPGDIFLVGANKPVVFDLARLEKLWAEEDVAVWLQLIGLLEPKYIFGTYVATRAEVVERIESWKNSLVQLNTDDRPLLEFQAPRSLYLTDPKVSEFPDSFPNAVPPQQMSDPESVMQGLLGRIQLDRLGGLEPRVQAAMKAGYDLAPLADAILRQRQGDTEGAEGMLRALSPELAKSSSVQTLLGDMRRRAQQWQPALLHYQNALARPMPGALYSLSMNAGSCAAQLKKFPEAIAYFQRAASLTTRPDPVYHAAEATLATRDEAGALALFQEALKRDPYDYLSLHRAALIELNQGKEAEAKAHAEAAYRSFPEMRSNVELLMRLAAKAGDQSLARRYQEEAQALHQREADAAARRQ